MKSYKILILIISVLFIQNQSQSQYYRPWIYTKAYAFSDDVVSYIYANQSSKLGFVAVTRNGGSRWVISDTLPKITSVYFDSVGMTGYIVSNGDLFSTFVKDSSSYTNMIGMTKVALPDSFSAGEVTIMNNKLLLVGTKTGSDSAYSIFCSFEEISHATLKKIGVSYFKGYHDKFYSNQTHDRSYIFGYNGVFYTEDGSSWRELKLKSKSFVGVTSISETKSGGTYIATIDTPERDGRTVVYHSYNLVNWVEKDWDTTEKTICIATISNGYFFEVTEEFGDYPYYTMFYGFYLLNSNGSHIFGSQGSGSIDRYICLASSEHKIWVFRWSEAPYIAYSTSVTDVQNKNYILNSFSLEQNYPNPFNPMTTISFTNPQNGFVLLKVFNFLGQEVATLIDGFQEAGIRSIGFDASNLNSGLYFYKIQVGNFTDVKKMILVK